MKNSFFTRYITNLMTRFSKVLGDGEIQLVATKDTKTELF